MYALYHNKDRNIIEIKEEPLWNSPSMKKYNPDIVNIWNENYYISSNKDAIIEKAKDLKETWILEYKFRIEALEKKKVVIKKAPKRKVIKVNNL